MSERVRAWEETITLPTYVPVPADRNPMFLERRVNQGTSGRVYPQPFTDRLGNVSEPVDYRAVYLENAYIRLMMLPQIGGRIHEAVDKTNGYPFLYRQHVIKPALIGLFGSWIAGGIEFNWPQHHRPSTYMPVQHLIEEHEDGSVTVWMSEHDPLQRMKGMVGLCLRPDMAYLEMKVQLYNRTPEAQTFLWWINAGVHAHDRYQVVFPPDVTVVTDHAKRSMSDYPIATGTYYGIDYGKEGQGTDLSWHDAIPVPTSYFVWHSDYDYFGGYDHARDAGIIHVADRFIAPGKKMFTWGNGEFAKGWEANLTDDDGPYIELMAGVYTDNQPDFSWLQPYETKTFSQFWYPVQQIGPTKNANRHAAVNLEVETRGEASACRIGVAVTENLPAASVSLSAGARLLLEQTVCLEPGAPCLAEVALPVDVQETDLLLRVLDRAGDEVIRYAPQAIERLPLPEPKTPPPPPEAFETTEELYLTGLHLEQYRHPTIDPEPYWKAALDRDPTDVRCNNAMGLVYLRRGLLAAACDHFQAAIDKLTARNPNPRDGEPYYNLGLARKAQGDLDAAHAAFCKAIWSYAWQAAGYYALAEIDCMRGDLAAALDHVRRSLATNALNTKARGLLAAVQRGLGRYDEAATVCKETLALDPLDVMARNELVLQAREQGHDDLVDRRLSALVELMTTTDPLSDIQAALDMAYDYANAGLWVEAGDVLDRLHRAGGERVSPMVLYALGHVAQRLGWEDDRDTFYREASATSPDYCFPVRLEEMAILEAAQAVRPGDGRIAYYMGNLYYDKKRYDEAIEQWERAVAAEPGFSIPWRNLGIAHYNVRHDPERAISCYERAFAANPADGRVLAELDELFGRTGATAEARLCRLEAHLDLARARDDLSVSLARLYVRTRQPQRALDYMLSRRFHPWEGGTGSIGGEYVAAHVQLGRTALAAGDAERALVHLDAARAPYPDNLGERKHLLWPDAEVYYLTGLAQRALGDEEGATSSFERVLAVEGGLSPVGYYQALSLRALEREDKAVARLRDLLDRARTRLDEEAARGFATSVPQFVFAEDDLETRRRVHLTYVIGLARLGLGERDEARAVFEAVLALAPNHAGAMEQLRGL